MLPVDSFTDAVSVLGYWGLMGLKLTSKRCSAIAHRCAGELRIFDLSDVECVVYVNHVSAFPHRPNDKRQLYYGLSASCQLEFADVHATARFVSEAFRNCVLGGLKVVDPDSLLLDALKNVAGTMVVAGTLQFAAQEEEYTVNFQEMVDVVDAFRCVTKLEIWDNYAPMSFTNAERTCVENVCRRRGILLSEEDDNEEEQKSS